MFLLNTASKNFFFRIHSRHKTLFISNSINFSRNNHPFSIQSHVYLASEYMKDQLLISVSLSKIKFGLANAQKRYIDNVYVIY